MNSIFHVLLLLLIVTVAIMLVVCFLPSLMSILSCRGTYQQLIGHHAWRAKRPQPSTEYIRAMFIRRFLHSMAITRRDEWAHTISKAENKSGGKCSLLTAIHLTVTPTVSPSSRVVSGSVEASYFIKHQHQHDLMLTRFHFYDFI